MEGWNIWPKVLFSIFAEMLLMIRYHVHTSGFISAFSRYTYFREYLSLGAAQWGKFLQNLAKSAIFSHPRICMYVLTSADHSTRFELFTGLCHDINWDHCATAHRHIVQHDSIKMKKKTNVLLLSLHTQIKVIFKMLGIDPI